MLEAANSGFDWLPAWSIKDAPSWALIRPMKTHNGDFFRGVESFT